MERVSTAWSAGSSVVVLGRPYVQTKELPAAVISFQLQLQTVANSVSIRSLATRKKKQQQLQQLQQQLNVQPLVALVVAWVYYVMHYPTLLRAAAKEKLLECQDQQYS